VDVAVVFVLANNPDLMNMKKTASATAAAERIPRFLARVHGRP